MPRHQNESSAPTHLLTIEEYLALGEPAAGYTELQEGRLLVSPSHSYSHMNVALELRDQLKRHLPRNLRACIDLDIDLGLSPSDAPGHSRRPDLFIHQRAAAKRVVKDGGLIHAHEITVVVEVVSPGPVRMDRVIKFAEYADAGIPHYWLIDTVGGQVSLTPNRLDEDGQYRRGEAVTGVFTTEDPFPLRIDLDSLMDLDDLY
ncbi:Uma2 family endonuclease [Actinokineospora enzanensis]|uniref:Uma2 family endonuclease n=1 Tax=Actinokineospora enzanensis TaxID=155975 RepID=UPI0004779040|nr:Uma2 family endonuclease [Actinokineospora enzanensis]